MSNTPPLPEFNPAADPKAAAAAAKAYAKASRPWFKKKRFIGPIALVVLIVLISAFSGGDEPSTPEADKDKSSQVEDKTKDAGEKAKEKAKPKPKPETTYVKVTAGELLKQFEKNELAGDLKYKGKNLEITGKVSAIDTEIFDDEQYILQIGTGSDFEFLTVNCNDMDSNELAKLEVGQSVTVRGEFDDGGSLGVEVANCRLA